MKNGGTHNRSRGAKLGAQRPSGDGRLHQRQLLRVCGLPAVRALFARDPGRVERLFFDPRLEGELAGPCAVMAGARKPFRRLAGDELARIGGTVLHGGVVAVARPQPLALLDPLMAAEWAQSGQPLLVLDRIGNSQNLGAIVRTAAFFGIERIVLADHPAQALPSDASYRTAEGGFEHLSLYRAALPAALRELRPTYRLVGTAPGRRPRPAALISERPPALILGNEEEGLDRPTLALCDEIATIPGSGTVQSLNVAAAAAILLYLATR